MASHTTAATHPVPTSTTSFSICIKSLSLPLPSSPPHPLTPTTSSITHPVQPLRAQAQGSTPPAATTSSSWGPAGYVVVVPTPRSPKSTLSSGKFQLHTASKAPSCHLWASRSFKVQVCAAGLSHTHTGSQCPCLPTNWLCKSNLSKGQ